MIVAKIKVDGVCAVAEYRKLIPAGIIGAQLQINYAPDIWQGLHKTVVFKGAVTKDVITDAEVVTIPAEVVAKRGAVLQVGVYGVDADGNIAIPTIWADLGTVRDAADPSGDTTTDPSLPVWAQLQAMIGNLDDLDTTAKNNLVAAVNEAMTKGGGEVDAAEIQRIVEDYLAANPPTVTESDPTVPAWAKQPQKPTYTAAEVGALPDTYTPPNQTAQQVGADPAGTAASAVSQHNVDATAHNDLRLALQELANRINTALDSDDNTLDQMSEVVAYIKSNKTLIDAITTSKVSVADIVNDLVTNVTDKPLSAAQGVAIKTLIDALRNDKLDAAELTNAVNTALAQAKESGEFDGQDGATPNIQIGTVETLAAGSPATASMGGTPENPILNLGIPQGASGSGGSGISVTGATVGQTVRIAAVDDDGVPTAWEPVDWPEDEWELLTKNAETGEEEPIVMDAETLKYEFPSLSDFKKLIVIFNKLHKSTSGLSGNVWFAVASNEARFLYSPSYAFNLLEINLSPIGMVMIHTFSSNNRQTINNSINKTVLSMEHFSPTHFDLPNSDWAEYYASCNTKITVWGARK